MHCCLKKPASWLHKICVIRQVVVSAWERRRAAGSPMPRPALMQSNLRSAEEVLQVCRCLRTRCCFVPQQNPLPSTHGPCLLPAIIPRQVFYDGTSM